MAIYIDPPAWPAHGTHFSHLISDVSITELHGFAAAAGIPERAFDRDHYDVPERRFAELVERGAQPVDAGHLVRRLISSGLRIRARERNESLLRPLLARWNSVLPGVDELGRELLERWGEPHRHYHNRTHLLSVLESVELLAGRGEHAAADSEQGPFLPGTPAHRIVVLAAWFHDAVYEGKAGDDEEASAELAEQRLSDAGHPRREAAEVARLVRLTAHHRPESGDIAGALLSDADLAVLGGSEQSYGRYVKAVRAEYAWVGDAAFTRGRAAVVEHLLSLDPLYHTGTARRLWLETARRNLRAEQELLSGRQD